WAGAHMLLGVKSISDRAVKALLQSFLKLPAIHEALQVGALISFLDRLARRLTLGDNSIAGLALNHAPAAQMIEHLQPRPVQPGLDGAHRSIERLGNDVVWLAL